MHDNDNDNDTLTLTQAAEYARITRQAVYVAIRNSKLRASKRGGRWLLLRADVDEYRLNKFTYRRISGKRVHDHTSGSYNLAHCALILSQVLGYSFTRMQTYAAVKSGILRSSRVGRYYVVTQADLASYASVMQQKAISQTQQLTFA